MARYDDLNTKTLGYLTFLSVIRRSRWTRLFCRSFVCRSLGDRGSMCSRSAAKPERSSQA